MTDQMRIWMDPSAARDVMHIDAIQLLGRYHGGILLYGQQYPVSYQCHIMHMLHVFNIFNFIFRIIRMIQILYLAFAVCHFETSIPLPLK